MTEERAGMTEERKRPLCPLCPLCQRFWCGLQFCETKATLTLVKIPACAGMTEEGAGMTGERAGFPDGKAKTMLPVRSGHGGHGDQDQEGASAFRRLPAVRQALQKG